MYEVKTSSREKNNKLRWLATNINFNSYTLGVLTLMAIRKNLVHDSPKATFNVRVAYPKRPSFFLAHSIQTRISILASQRSSHLSFSKISCLMRMKQTFLSHLQVNFRYSSLSAYSFIFELIRQYAIDAKVFRICTIIVALRNHRCFSK